MGKRELRLWWDMDQGSRQSQLCSAQAAVAMLIHGVPDLRELRCVGRVWFMLNEQALTSKSQCTLIKGAVLGMGNGLHQFKEG